MPLVQAKCTTCGVNLEVDSAKDAAICPYCGIPYVVEKAIRLFNANGFLDSTAKNFDENEKIFSIRGGVLERYNGESTDVVIPPTVQEIGLGVFARLRIAHVTIPESVVSIGQEAFCGCSQLQEVRLPSSIRYIGPSTFRGCISLKRVDFPDGLSCIATAAFAECISLEDINLPSAIEYVAQDDEDCKGAFDGCRNLKNVTLPFDAESVFRTPDSIRYSDKQVLQKWRIIDAFRGTPWYKKLETDYQMEQRKAKHRCLYCGHRFNILTGRCMHCGKAKSY